MSQGYPQSRGGNPGAPSSATTDRVRRPWISRPTDGDDQAYPTRMPGMPSAMSRAQMSTDQTPLVDNRQGTTSMGAGVVLALFVEDRGTRL